MIWVFRTRGKVFPSSFAGFLRPPIPYSQSGVLNRKVRDPLRSLGENTLLRRRLISNNRGGMKWIFSMCRRPKPFLKHLNVPGTNEFVNLVRSCKILEKSWQESWRDILWAVLEAVLEAVLWVSWKLLQDVLVRILLRSCKISGIFEPGLYFKP